MKEKISEFVYSHREEMVDIIRQLVEIPSVKGKPEQSAPFGAEPRRALDKMLEICREHGFVTGCHDNVMGTADYAPSGKVGLGILCHLDVVPAEPLNWSCPPFQLTRRLVRGREASAKEGKYVGSVPPYGYRKVKIPNDKGFTLEIIEEQAKVVRMIFEWYAEGAEVNGQKKRIGPYTIAVRLNELGIKSVAGKDYWTIYGVQHMLINPVYIGKIRWGYRKVKKTVTPEGMKKKSREFAQDGDYIVVDGLHEPILSEELFYKVQDLIAANPPTPIKYRNNNVNPFAGLIFCAKCGHCLSYRKGYGRHPGYLGCNIAGCDNKAAPFELIEQRVLSILNSWVKDYSVDKAQIKHEADLNVELSNAISLAEKEIETLQDQLDKVYSFFERGTYTEKIFKQRSSAIEQQITDIGEKIDRLKAEHQQVLERQNVQAEFVPSIKHLLEIYDTLEPVEKNKWLKQIIDHMVYEKNADGKYRNVDPGDFTLGILPRLPKKGS